MRGITKALISIILGLALLLPFASTSPDGLEKVAESLNIKEPEISWSGPMPDYTFPFTENPYIPKLISGLIGLFLVLGITWIVGRANTLKNRVSK